MKELAELAKSIGASLVSWNWTKKLLYWVVMSAGTGAECAFLIASLWVTINASVHNFVLLFMSEQTTIHLSELATVAYVGLPECILALAIVTTLSHIRVWLYSGRKDNAALMWSVLYGVPTIIFLVLSLITIGCSMLSVTFQLPPYMIVTRGLSGYFYGLIALLYTQLGTPQERDRLQKKDGLLAELRRDKDVFIDALRNEKDNFIDALRRDKDAMIAELQKDNARLIDLTRSQKEELQKQNTLLAESKETQTELLKAVNKSSDNALQAYSEECINWLKSGVKTVLVDDITRFTGHSKRKIANAITGGNLLTSPRNKELILVSSLTEWLKNNPPIGTKVEQENIPQLRLVNG